MRLSPEQLAKQAKIIKLDRECRDDPVRFFNTFLFTFDPKRAPFHLPFNTFPFQDELILNIVRHIEQGRDLFIDKCREMGATYTVLGTLLWYWRYREASNFLLGSRREGLVDNVGGERQEMTNKEESLFGKLDYMINRIPPIALPVGYDANRHRTFMNITNPELGNIIAGEAGGPNFSRGGRQRAIMMDEFAFWENDTSAWGSTADTTNCRIVLTTPGIRGNTKAKRLRFGKDGEVIDIVTLDYTMDPRKDQAWIDRERERRSADDFAREIMINWDGSTAGVVYPEARHREVGYFPHDPDRPTYITWDFGLDGTAIQWWQTNPTNGKLRLIDAFTKVNVPIQWFFPFLGEGFDSMFEYNTDELDAIDRVKGITHAIHFGDPDAAKRSMTSRALTSVREELSKINIHVRTNTMANTFINRRERTKVMLQKGIEVNDTPGTEVWIECMDNARYPQRSGNNQATTPVPAPIHDYTSHHRTATEYLAVNYLKNNESRGSVSTPNSSKQNLVIGNVPLGRSISNILNRGNDEGSHWML
jgi:hypothetical protein